MMVEHRDYNKPDWMTRAVINEVQPNHLEYFEKFNSRSDARTLETATCQIGMFISRRR